CLHLWHGVPSVGTNLVLGIAIFYMVRIPRRGAWEKIRPCCDTAPAGEHAGTTCLCSPSDAHTGRVLRADRLDNRRPELTSARDGTWGSNRQCRVPGVVVLDSCRDPREA